MAKTSHRAFAKCRPAGAEQSVSGAIQNFSPNSFGSQQNAAARWQEKLSLETAAPLQHKSAVHFSMKRQDFLKGIGLAGLGALPFARAAAQLSGDNKGAACPTLVPAETAGPFPLDLTTNNATTFFRQDIRESKPGTTCYLTMKVLGASNCLPIANARVNVWMCDAAGIYSGYNNSQNPGSLTATYARGYQMTDAAGEAKFTIIFPGWYNGRICHIHFQVVNPDGTTRVSQFTFEIAAKNALYAANPNVYTKGSDGTAAFSSDNIFSDGVSEQLATLAANGDGTYNIAYTATVSGTGAASVGTQLEQLGFSMGQNFPNPYTGRTTVPFTLAERSDVKLAIYDLNARRLTEIERRGLSAGEHTILVDMDELRLSTANYLYQLEVTSSRGTTRDVKMMTAQR